MSILGDVGNKISDAFDNVQSKLGGDPFADKTDEELLAHALRVNPAFAKQYWADQAAKKQAQGVANWAQENNPYGQQQMEQVVEPQRQELMGPRPESGGLLGTDGTDFATVNQITQNAQEGQGLLGSMTDPRKIQMVKQYDAFMKSGVPQLQDIAMKGMNDIHTQVLKAPAANKPTTMEVGAGNGMSQKVTWNPKTNQWEAEGSAYRTHAPQAQTSYEQKRNDLIAAGVPPEEAARTAMRNQVYDTVTGYTNASTGEQVLTKDIAGGEEQKVIGKDVGQKVVGFDKAMSIADNTLYENKRLQDDLSELAGMTNNWTAGVGSYLQNIPTTDANVWKNLKDSIIARNVVGTMKEMKAQSPTGATGFGALSERELNLLETLQRSLNQAQSPAAIKNNIIKMNSHLEQINARIERDRKKYQAWNEGRGSGTTQRRQTQQSDKNDPLGIR